MNCMFGGFSSITLSTKMEGNLSRQGTRITISPIPKYKILLSSSIAIFIIHYIKMLVLLAYLIFTREFHYEALYPYRFSWQEHYG